MSITIDFNTLIASSNNLGHIGEHNATELQITYVNEDTRCKQYRIAFATRGETVLSKTYTEMPISIYLWQQLTMCPRMSIQVICYDEEGEYIGKSAKMSGFYFEPSISNTIVETDGSNPDLAGEITGIDDRLSDAEATLLTKADKSSLDDYAKETELADYLKSADAEETYATKTELTSASHMELVNRSAPRVCLHTIEEIYDALNNDRVLTFCGNPLAIRRFSSTNFIGTYVDGVYEYAVSMSTSEYPTLTVKNERVLATEEELSAKQDALVNQQNIRSINGESLLGKGNITIESGSGNVDDVLVNGTSVVNEDKQAIITVPAVPTVVSAFTNDAGYLTEHQSLDGYATEEWVEDKGYITSAYHDSTKADAFETATTIDSTTTTAIPNCTAVKEYVAEQPKPISYSTEEQDTGLTWIDGKKIYQRTLVITNLESATTATDYDITSWNINEIIGHNTIGYKEVDSVYIPLYADGVECFRWWCRTVGSTRVLRIKQTAGNLMVKAHVTLRYTKTEA